MKWKYIKCKHYSLNLFSLLHLHPTLLLLLVFSFVSKQEAKADSKKNILFLSFVATRSHQNIYEPLLRELAERGHDVTLVTPIKTANTKKSITNTNVNFHEIHLANTGMEQLLEAKVRSVFHQKSVENNSLLGKLMSMPFMAGEKFASICRRAYEDPQVKELMWQSKKKFDLIFLKTFQNECTYGLAHYFNTTTVMMTTVAPFRWNVGALGGFYSPSFIPGFSAAFTHDMDFFQRAVNFLGELAIVGIRHYVYLPIMESVYKDYLGSEFPSSYDIERNASLLLMNSDPTLNYPRPHLPNMIEVGGMHLQRSNNPLPKDLEDFINSFSDPYNNGFIYFSMGSILKSHMMPEKTRLAFLAAFSKLKQRVIWKWEIGHMENLPANVKLMKWLPQQDLLAHEKIRAFITHGGLLSIQEASYHGVPLIGIPMFGDQNWNMKHAQTLQFALTLEFETLDENKILTAITNITEDPKYRRSAQELSRIIQDHLQSPLDRAVYWIEYVLRHQGATHLRSAGRNLNFFQYHSLDIISTITVAISVFSFILLYITKLIFKSFYLRCFRIRNRAAELKIKTHAD